jgi:hypothetical protein
MARGHTLGWKTLPDELAGRFLRNPGWPDCVYTPRRNRMSMKDLQQQEQTLRLAFYDANFHGDKETMKAVLKQLEAVLFQQNPANS